MFGKRIEEVEEADLAKLVRDKQPESQSLDYKQELLLRPDPSEFLADVTAFANTAGGYLVYGVMEERDVDGKPTGIPQALVGIKIPNHDQLGLHIEGVLRQGVQPPLWGATPHMLKLTNGRSALIVSVPRSWASPHAVTVGGSMRFHGRTSRGKYPLDVSELRAAFLRSTSTGDQLSAIRSKWRYQWGENGSPMGHIGSARVILHLVPFSALDPGSPPQDMGRMAALGDLLKPMSRFGVLRRFNADGLLVYSEERLPVGGGWHPKGTYLQVFRNNILEYGDGVLLATSDESNRRIQSEIFEQQVIDAVKRGLSILDAMNVALPIAVLLTLFGVSRYRMVQHNRRLEEDAPSIDRGDVEAPDILIVEKTPNVGRVLKPAFDVIWNACGFQHSLNYRPDGEWEPPPSSY